MMQWSWSNFNLQSPDTFVLSYLIATVLPKYFMDLNLLIHMPSYASFGPIKVKQMIIYGISTWACSSYYFWEISKSCAILQNTSIFRHISSLGSLLLTYNIWDGPIHLTLFQEWAAACRCCSLYPPWSNITQKL